MVCSTVLEPIHAINENLKIHSYLQEQWVHYGYLYVVIVYNLDDINIFSSSSKTVAVLYS